MIVYTISTIDERLKILKICEKHAMNVWEDVYNEKGKDINEPINFKPTGT
jgi:hypothetical protein